MCMYIYIYIYIIVAFIVCLCFVLGIRVTSCLFCALLGPRSSAWPPCSRRRGPGRTPDKANILL